MGSCLCCVLCVLMTSAINSGPAPAPRKVPMPVLLLSSLCAIVIAWFFTLIYLIRLMRKFFVWASFDGSHVQVSDVLFLKIAGTIMLMVFQGWLIALVLKGGDYVVK